MPTQRSQVVKYAVVCGLIAWAVVTSFMLKQVMEPSFFLPFITVVLVSSWFFGRNEGLLATALSTIVIDYFFSASSFSLLFASWTEAARLLTFVLTSLLVTFLVAELRYSKVRLTATLSSIGDAVLVTDRAGRVTFLNPGAEAMIGYPLAEARKRPLSDVLVLIDDVTGGTVNTPLTAILTTGESYQSTTHKMLTSRHGQTLSVEESIAPIRDHNGKVAGAIFVLRDITARRQAQDQLSQSQKMAAIGRLAGGIAGDFNNLLTVITGYSEMLRDEISAADPLRRFAEEIFFAAERAAGLTRQLLAFSRSQSADVKIIHLPPLLAAMETMLNRLMGDKIAVVIMPSAAIGRIRADPAQMEQIIVNLAMNSRDAMPNGGRFLIDALERGCPGRTKRRTPRHGTRGIRDAHRKRYRLRHGFGYPRAPF